MARTYALKREIKSHHISLHSVSQEGQFSGYACLFGKQDLGGDIVERGAFAKSLASRDRAGIKLLYQHDPASPIGHWLEIREDARGLFVKGQLSLDVQRGREVHSMMRAGILDGLSIGFRTVKARKEQKSGLRHLMQVDLWEISIVTFPMQPDARVNRVKAECLTHSNLSKRILERKLTQDAGLSRSQARALMAHGYQGLGDRQDAVTGIHTLTHSMRQATRTLRTHLM